MTASLTAFLTLTCLTPAEHFCDVQAHAERTPADVDVFLHIERAAALRSSLEKTPLASPIAESLHKSTLAAAWHALASGRKVGERELFNRLIGKSATLVITMRDDEAVEKSDDVLSWAVLTEVNDRDWSRLSRDLKLRAHSPKHGVAIRSLPDHQLVFGRSDDTVLIGPLGGHSNLFYDMLRRLDGEAEDSLGRLPAFAMASRLGEADILLVMRHDLPLGGLTAVAANLDDGAIAVRHESRFENSPFGDAPRPATIRSDLIELLRQSQVCVVAHPLEWPAGPAAMFLQARFPPGAIARQMRESLGRRFLVIVGEVPHAPRQLLATTVAVEVEPTDHALADLDALATGIVAVLAEASDLPNPLDENPLKLTDPESLRIVPVGEHFERLFANVPGMRCSSLCWTVESTTAHTWWLISSNPCHLNVVAATLLEYQPDEGAGEIDLSGQRGVLNACAGGEHLHRLARDFAAAVPGEEAGSLTDALVTLARFLRAADSVTWTTDVPGQNRFRSEWRISFECREKTHDHPKK